MPYYIKIISVFLLATVKYFYTPLYAYLIDLNFTETVITMTSGGVVSFLFFYYISYFVIISVKYVKPVASKIAPRSLAKAYVNWLAKRDLKRQNRKVFSRRNRLMVKMRRVGMWAIILLTPITLSIPVGAFLLRRYYQNRRGVVIFTIMAIIVEGAALCWLIWHFPVLRP